MATAKVTSDANRRVKFEEAGPGVYLLLRNSGLRTLHGYYDKEHVTVVEEAFITVNFPVLDRLLEIMVWKGDEPFAVSFEDLDGKISIEGLIEKIRDAWSLSLNGRTYREQIKHAVAERRRLGKLAEDPLLTSPEDGTAPSDAPRTGQA